MIDEFNLAKSCLDKLKAYADSQGYAIAMQGKTFNPVADEIYLREFLLSNDNFQGLSNSSTQEQRPIYQINICVPKVMGKWVGLTILSALKSTFERGGDISLIAGQKVIVERVNTRSLDASDTHNIIAVSVDLTALG